MIHHFRRVLAFVQVFKYHVRPSALRTEITHLVTSHRMSYQHARPPNTAPPRVPPHKTASPNNKGRRLDVLSLVKYSTKKFHIGPVLKYKEMLLRRLWKTRRFSCNYARHFKMSTAASRREHAHKHDVCTWTCGASEPSNAQQTRLGLPSSGTPRGSKCTV